MSLKNTELYSLSLPYQTVNKTIQKQSFDQALGKQVISFTASEVQNGINPTEGNLAISVSRYNCTFMQFYRFRVIH